MAFKNLFLLEEFLYILSSSLRFVSEISDFENLSASCWAKLADPPSSDSLDELSKTRINF